jgi:hypothetical protein
MTVGFTHGFVKQGGYDAAVGVAGRSLELFGQSDAAEDALLVIDEELQVESGVIVVAATEAAVECAVGQWDFAWGCAFSHAVACRLR